MSPSLKRSQPALLVASFLMAAFPVHAADPAAGVTFDRLAQAAISTAPTINAKRREFEGAGFGVSAAKWGRWPSVSMTTGSSAAYLQRNSNQVLTRPGTTLRLDQPLYTWNAVDGRIDLAQTQQEAARLNVAIEVNSVLERLIGAFVQLQQGQERLAIQSNGLERLAEYEGMVERRLATQVSSQNDVSLVRARIEQLRSDIAATEAALTRARATTSELTSEAVDRVQPLGTPGWDLARGLAYWTQLVLDASPELASARNQVVAVDTEISVRRAETKPRVVMRVESIHSPTTAGTSTNYTQAYVSIEAALSNGLSQFDAISQLLSRREAAQRQVEAIERGVRQQVQAIWADMDALSGQVPAIDRVIKSNEDVVDSFVRQYVAGRKSWLDVLNSERELLQSRLGAADLRAQSASATLRSNRLTGSLAQTAWQPGAAPAPAAAAAPGAAGRSGAWQ